jgi:2-polyprenyl-3-methyl-5-hydroxy-6-metoxy-1,4-benzoquinol methylase
MFVTSELVPRPFTKRAVHDDPCPLCARPEPEFLFVKDRGTRTLSTWAIHLYKCRACGMVFSLPRMGFAEELYDYYAERLSWPEERIYNPLNDLRLRELFGGFAQLVSGRKLLDVGCGDGTFVRAGLSAGWDARGIELSESAVALCQRFGLPVGRTDLFSSSLDDRWDVIIMSELLEHVTWPVAFLVRAEELLRPGGLLYLTTPNFNCVERVVSGKSWESIHAEHVNYFSPYTIRRMIESFTSLRIVYMRCDNIMLGGLLAGARQRFAFGGDTGRGISARTVFDERIREASEKSRALRWLKALINFGLNRTRLGSSLKVLCRKSHSHEQPHQEQ